jgi:hypothetical protein
MLMESRGRLSTVDLLALTTLDQLVLAIKILLAFFAKRATLRLSILTNVVRGVTRCLESISGSVVIIHFFFVTEIG